MLSEQEIGEIEERADIVAADREFRCLECQEAWDVVTVDVPALLADRKELLKLIKIYQDGDKAWSRTSDSYDAEIAHLKGKAERLNAETSDREKASFEEHAALHFQRDSAKEANELYIEALAERDRLQAENAELLAKLERLNPMPVKRERTLYGDHVCPNCAAAFIGIVKVNGKLRNTTPYCGNCGQRIDWGEDAQGRNEDK